MLLHYKRKEIQQAIIDNSLNAEVGIRYADKGFGKRPDALVYPNDVIELVKKGATSFHISEEHWKNPMQLKPELKQEELDSLRTGWDLIIDVDFELWEGTKIIADAIVRALRNHGIKSVSAKFSGNKGFHIAVPFESFPEKVYGKETRTLFPEATRRILSYICQYIDSPENNYELSRRIMGIKGFVELKNADKNLVALICGKCGNKAELKTKKTEFICPGCEKKIVSEGDARFMICEKCKVHMKRIETTQTNRCKKCGSRNFIEKVNLAIDAVLISGRHLYRSVYSLHEKSGLASVPVNPEKILEFDKSMAKPTGLNVGNIRFLDRKSIVAGEANTLLVQAFDYKPRIEEEKKKQGLEKDFEIFQNAVSPDFFPPCMLKILQGIEDGKKRSVFIMTNFLTSVGWNHEDVEKLLTEWNKKNREQLREVNITGHLRYHKKLGKKVLPPNCSNDMYYKAFNVCFPDELCARIKNPVQYVRLKTKYLKKSKRNVKKKADRNTRKAE